MQGALFQIKSIQVKSSSRNFLLDLSCLNISWILTVAIFNRVKSQLSRSAISIVSNGYSFSYSYSSLVLVIQQLFFFKSWTLTAVIKSKAYYLGGCICLLHSVTWFQNSFLFKSRILAAAILIRCKSLLFRCLYLFFSSSVTWFQNSRYHQH